MGKTDVIYVRVKPEEKKLAMELCERYGLTLSAAITMFIRQSLNADELPFMSDNPAKPNQ